MSSVTVSTKGQIVLPAEVRRTLGIVGGSRLEVTVIGNEVVLKSTRGDREGPLDRGAERCGTEGACPERSRGVLLSSRR